MAERIAVIVEGDVEAPLAHGFVARHAAVIESLRRHGHVTVIRVADEDGPGAAGADTVVVPRPVTASSDAGRLVRALRVVVGAGGWSAGARSLVAAVEAARPTMVVCLTWQRRDVAAVVASVAPCALFVEERQSATTGGRLRWSFPPPIVAWLEGIARRRMVARCRAVVVIGPAEVPWAERAFARPVVVVPMSLPERALPRADRRDEVRVVAVGNLAEERNAEGLVAIIDEARRHGWPASMTFEVVSATGYTAAVIDAAATADGHVVLSGAVDDLDPILEQATCLLVPAFHALGIKTQILLGWSAGVPVVTTMRSARTVAGVDGVDLLVGDTPAAVVEHLASLHGNVDADALVAAGRRRLAADFSASVVDQAIDEVVAMLRLR
jgi:glycosyltransferase involved in cell wall biosynthesis